MSDAANRKFGDLVVQPITAAWQGANIGRFYVDGKGIHVTEQQARDHIDAMTFLLETAEHRQLEEAA